ncbi:MAG: RdgB/HAM1 family non-canonical purine NTP pyrophosphatase [Firmicutes bacterium]|nr:RdgB/HAM1 family non-canonical purine NTP pyrophosphatase [Bacillota bacterium]
MIYLFATNNPGKVKEIQAVFNAAGLKMVTLGELGLFFEPTETGSTFEENAIQKAVKTSEFLGKNGHENVVVLADDSGLCIDAMGGAPGVDSANFMGRETPYEVRNAHIIKELQNSGNRVAKFVCVIACAFPNGQIITTEAAIHGEIAHAPSGEGGFGFDPIFYIPEYGKTSAELTMEEKNKISHRGKALALMIRKLTS